MSGVMASQPSGTRLGGTMIAALFCAAAADSRAGVGLANNVRTSV